MARGIRRVRLRVTRLDELMRSRGVNATDLAEQVGSPSFSTIYRWLRRARTSPDAVTEANEEHVRRIADVLEVGLDELVDEPIIDDVGTEQLLRLVAALGPVVYPRLLAILGCPATEEMLTAAGLKLLTLQDHETAGPRWRFERWQDCERLLDDATQLPRTLGAKGLRWALRWGVEEASEPALMYLLAVAAEKEAASWSAGLTWLRRAKQGGPPAQAAWIGERLLGRLGGRPLEVVIEVVLKLAGALRMAGSPTRALEVVSEALMRPTVLADRGAVGRLRIELARIHNLLGQIDAALLEAQQAEQLLTPGGASQWLSDAVQEHAFLLQRTGRIDEAGACLRRLEAVRREGDLPPAPRFYRLLGINALEHGLVEVARRRFEEAVRTAEAAGIAREAGLGNLNVALACALADDREAAEAWFRAAQVYAAGGEPGPLGVGLVHLNYGEYTLAMGHPEAAMNLLQIGHEQFELSGGPPGLKGRCQTLLAEACAELGRFDKAQAYARDAHRGALMADNPMYVAQALTAGALALGDRPDEAVAWAEAALRELHSLSPDRHIVDRLGVERRCAEVRLRAGQRDVARATLSGLAERARARGILSELRAVDRILQTL